MVAVRAVMPPRTKKPRPGEPSGADRPSAGFSREAKAGDDATGGLPLNQAADPRQGSTSALAITSTLRHLISSDITWLPKVDQSTCAAGSMPRPRSGGG